MKGLRNLRRKGVIFNDGKQAQFEAVILATEYRPRLNAFLTGLSAVCDESGIPLSSRPETRIPGLYFCGYYVGPTGMLREIGLKAKRISASMAGKHTLQR